MSERDANPGSSPGKVLDDRFRAAVGALTPGQAVVDDIAPGITGAILLELFESQATSRQLDLAARQLGASKRGFYSIGSSGHEGNAALGLALRVTDPALLHYRSGAFFVQRTRQVPGLDPIRDVLLGIVAAAADPISGGRHKVFGSKPAAIIPQTSTIASHLPRAVGLAFAIDRAARLGVSSEWPSDAVVLCSFGDASANHSTAAGAINAAIHTARQGVPLPILFLCEDNGIGISVPTPADWIQQAYGSRAGLEYFGADGCDPVDALTTSTAAAAWVREHRKPAFLHMRTVRLMGHAGSDVEAAYRRPADIATDLLRDPLTATARLLVATGTATPTEVLDRYDNIAHRVTTTAELVWREPKLTSAAAVMTPLAPTHPALVRENVLRADASLSAAATMPQAQRRAGEAPSTTSAPSTSATDTTSNAGTDGTTGAVGATSTAGTVRTTDTVGMSGTADTTSTANTADTVGAAGAVGAGPATGTAGTADTTGTANTADTVGAGDAAGATGAGPAAGTVDAVGNAGNALPRDGAQSSSLGAPADSTVRTAHQGDALHADAAHATCMPQIAERPGDRAPNHGVAVADPMTLGQAINRTLANLLTRDPDVLVFGEDVGRKGGVYGVTKGLQKQFGKRRVFDTLLDEQSVLGTALGTALAGFIPIPEIQYLAYVHNAADQLRGEAATLSFFSGGQYRNPMVVRIAGYAYQKGFGGHFHNDDSIAALRDIPGVIVASPARADDAAALLRTCVSAARVDGRVCIYLEPIALYHTRDLYKPGDNAWLATTSTPHAEIGRARVYGDGTDLTIVTFANGVPMSLRVARRLADRGIRTRILDLRWLSPLPEADILHHARATGRVLIADETRHSGGVSESVCAALIDAGFEGRISRVTSEDTFIPLGPAADTVLLDEVKIETAAGKLLAG
ncbi:thiamine pyrophosphate-dependent enzyme [Nocardia sp. NPDC051321]|uniref:thiamine pyrophosphate-dependent enzyme n=1 Tax=Nocardia sp. NPDC051321 TaxID=3364323 RepID=UPI0037B11D8B